MKYGIIFGVILFSGAALAGEGWHNFSSGENPHASGGCASKNKDKVAQFHKFHGKDWKQQVDSDKKVETPEVKKEPKLEEFI